MLFCPRVHCRTGTLAGFEVLPRWSHPEGGTLDAQDLMEMAHARGLAGEMAEHSLAWLSHWRDSAPHEPLGSRVLETLRLALPLPAHSPTWPALFDTLEQRCRDHGIPPETITLEIAAPVLLDNAPALESLEDPRARGFRLCLAGVSADEAPRLQDISALFSEIKADGPLITEATVSEEYRDALRSVIDLGDRQASPLVAPGVEDQATLDCLCELGCSLAQGSLISPPLPGAEVLEWFRGREGRREAHRLDTLAATGLLDTSPEERFDRLTHLAQHLLEVPITLITLVDRDRQWFKSRQGLDIPEIPRDIAFCHSTIQLDELMEIPDARRDVRFRDNPLVTGPPYIRFYAGQPLCLATGEKVGSLCIIETQPRTLEEDEKQLLSYLALHVEEELAARLPDARANVSGLLDEAMFLARATSAFSLCRRFGFNAVLIRVCMTNIPRIKQLHGAAAAEALIQQVGAVIAEAAIPAELVGRLGDDVVALLMEATLGEVRALCEQLEAAILEWNGRGPPGAPRIDCHIDVASDTFDEEDALDDMGEEAWTRYATID
jgi:EAL domain-containing protein (putative c-di-GMP-specific phosphodiesterase class I)/GGDEF domain-containing protein